MTFETTKDVLNWYENQPRALTDDFIRDIPWGEVANYPFDMRFVRVLEYMRNVETMTDMYHRELRRTPTGRDPVIGKFMERWGVEEVTHGEVLNRFLNELGIETDDDWQTQVRASVPAAYNMYAFGLTTLANMIGRSFTATHMTFGAVHEMTTAQSYRRLMELADHPVLTKILQAIVREEAAHTQFYWSVARIELKRNNFNRKMARFVIDHFYQPVGQGSNPKKETEYAVSTLFAGNNGIETLDNLVTKRVQKLPGFDDVSIINKKIGAICSKPPQAAERRAARQLLLY